MAKILLVDDNPRAFATFREILAVDGHSVEPLNTSKSRPPIVSSEPPDLILLDLDLLSLPAVAVERIVVHHHERPSIPLMVYSSRSDYELALAADAVGAVAWARRGAPPQDLRAAVAAALGAG